MCVCARELEPVQVTRQFKKSHRYKSHTSVYHIKIAVYREPVAEEEQSPLLTHKCTPLHLQAHTYMHGTQSGGNPGIGFCISYMRQAGP